VASAAASTQEPSQLAKYLFDLAKVFSGYYQAVPILGDSIEFRQPRLLLCSAVRQTLANGLSLLGIETVDQM
jgi:arginyl-tRNA synthetase